MYYNNIVIEDAMVCRLSLMLSHFYSLTGICQRVLWKYRKGVKIIAPPEAGVSSFKQLCKTKETGDDRWKTNGEELHTSQVLNAGWTELNRDKLRPLLAMLIC